MRRQDRRGQVNERRKDMLLILETERAGLRSFRGQRCKKVHFEESPGYLGPRGAQQPFRLIPAG